MPRPEGSRVVACRFCRVVQLARLDPQTGAQDCRVCDGYTPRPLGVTGLAVIE